MSNDQINRPSHYTSHPSGIEAIVIAERLNFCLGNAFKYLFRCSHKGNALEDLKKAEWYLNHELNSRVDRWWYRFLNSDTQAYGIVIGIILRSEFRYSGHMAAALNTIYVGGIHCKSREPIERALRSVRMMIKIQENKVR